MDPTGGSEAPRKRFCGQAMAFDGPQKRLRRVCSRVHPTIVWSKTKGQEGARTEVVFAAQVSYIALYLGRLYYIAISALPIWVVNRWKSTRPSPAIKENNRRQTGKAHFCDQKCALPALRAAKSTFESRFGRNWVTFWTLLAVIWLQKA